MGLNQLISKTNSCLSEVFVVIATWV